MAGTAVWSVKRVHTVTVSPGSRLTLDMRSSFCSGLGWIDFVHLPVDDGVVDAVFDVGCWVGDAV